MTIEELLRTGQVQTGENGFVYASLISNGHGPAAVLERPLEKLIATVPRPVVERLGRSACYFVPWLVKQRRGIAIATAAAAEGETRRELCHHLDVKPQSNLLLISTQFYENDAYGLAMEFFDKVAYLAALERDTRTDFYEVLRVQAAEPKAGEISAEAWEWRQSQSPPAAEAVAGGAALSEDWRNYERAAEADALGLYMGSLFTDVFYEDLHEPGQNFPALSAEMIYRRVRALERLYPPNRGYSFQVVRQRSRRRGGR